MSLTPGELAKRLGARLSRSEGDEALTRIALPGSAQAADLCFVAPGVTVSASQACGAWLAGNDAGHANTLLVDDVVLACARAAAWLAPRRRAAHLAERHTEC